MARRRLEEALQASRLKAAEEEAEKGRDVSPRRVSLAHDPHGIFSLGFGPAGRQLAAGFGDGALQLVDTETGLPESSSSLKTGPLAGPVTAVCFLGARPGLLLAAGAEGSVAAFLPPDRSPVASLAEEGNETHALDVCRDGSAFATAGKDRHLRLYDTRTLQVSMRGMGRVSGPCCDSKHPHAVDLVVKGHLFCSSCPFFLVFAYVT
nr:uncharacterized protein LOC132777298 [Anolis sagrei ordinatus]